MRKPALKKDASYIAIHVKFKFSLRHSLLDSFAIRCIAGRPTTPPRIVHLKFKCTSFNIIAGEIISSLFMLVTRFIALTNILLAHWTNYDSRLIFLKKAVSLKKWTFPPGIDHIIMKIPTYQATGLTVTASSCSTATTTVWPGCQVISWIFI